MQTRPFRSLVVVLAAIALAGCGAGGGDVGTTETRARPAASAEPAAGRTVSRRAVRLVRVGRFDTPVYVTAPPQDRRRLFVVERAGRVVVVRDGRRLSRPFLDIRDRVRAGGEQGLLSMAFAPDYAESRRFYVYFTDRSGDVQVVEYRARSADRAAAASARRVLTVPQPQANHNGGLLLFGPDDLLYIGTGDGGGAGDPHGPRGNAQNLANLLGKLLRIDPRRNGSRPYTVPRSNPFHGRAGARKEIYAYGLRNPWRFSFDRRTGDLAIGDVGQSAFEEVTFVRRGKAHGANFGWRVFEGRSRYAPGESAPGHVPPVIVLSHGEGNCSVTGGVVVRDRALAGLYGRYIFGDFCRGRILSARLARPRAKAVRQTRLRVPSLSSFGEDARGRVHAVSLDGPVYRLVPR